MMLKVCTTARIKIMLIGFILFLTLLNGFVIAENKKIFRVAYIPVLTNLPIIVSYESDKLNFKHIQIKLVKYNSYNALEAAIRVNAVDAALMPVAVVLSMAGDGIKINAVGTCYSGGSRLIARTEGSLESVKGYLIGVPGLDSSENLHLSSVLKEYKLRNGLEYKSIGISYATIINDLKTKRVDAIYLQEPFGTLAEKEKIGFEVTGQKGKLTGQSGSVLIVQSSLLKSNEKGVYEWLRSIVDTCRFIENDTKELNAKQTNIIQAKYFHYPGDVFVDILTNHKGGLTFTKFLINTEELKVYLDLGSKMKLLTKSVNLEQLISLKLMKRAIK